MLLRAIRRKSSSLREHSLKLIVRSMLAFAFVAILFALPLQAQEAAASSSAASAAPQVTSAPNYEISGSARSGKTPLPGAAVTAANTLTGKKICCGDQRRGQVLFRRASLAAAMLCASSSWVFLSSLRSSCSIRRIHQQRWTLNCCLPRDSNNNRTMPAQASPRSRGFQSLAVDSTLSSLAGGDSAFGAAGSTRRCAKHQ